MSNRWWNKLAEAIPRGIGWSKKAIFLRANYGTLFCKESNPIYELRPTLAENNYEWWTSTLDFLQVYIPRTPIRKPGLFDAYLQKVLGRERNSDVVQKLEFIDDNSGLSIEFCAELIHAFLQLVESFFIASVGTQSDDDTKEACHETEDFLLEEEFMRHLLKEERLFLEDERLFKEEKRVRLEDQNRLKLEQERELQVKKRWDEDYKKRSYAVMNSDHMKQAMARCAPKKRSGSVGVRNDSWVQVCRKFDKKKECFGVVDQDMTEFLKTIKPWVEVDYMWHVRPHNTSRAMVSSYFVQLLLQNSMPLWYVNREMYPIAWTEADKVFIPINETGQHWFLAEFDIKSGVVTFYDSGDLYDLELKDWYIGTRDCLKVRLPKVLELLNVFDKKGIEKSTYHVTFRIDETVPKQGVSLVIVGSGYVFFLYRLANGLSLDVEDPVQVALAYRERLAQVYFSNKVV
ncbi:phospholipase-like protein [Tanacetum coccineum]